MRERIPSFVVLVASLGWVSIWNGFPLLMGDSTGYVQSWILAQPQAIRPSLYPYVIGVLSHAGSLAGVAFFQVIVAAWTMEILFTRGLGWRLAESAAAAAIIGVASTLPWWANTIMTDVFFGLEAVAAWLLVWRGERLAGLERAGLWTIVAAVPTLHPGIGLSVIVALVPFCVATLLGHLAIPSLRRAALVLSACVVGYLAFPLLNYSHGNGFVGSSASARFMAARLGGDRLLEPAIRRVLRPQQRAEQALARYRDVLGTPMDDQLGFFSLESFHTQVIMHMPESPFALLDRDRDRRIYGRLVRESMKREPLANLVCVLAGTARLLRYPAIPLYIAQPRQLGTTLGEFMREPYPRDFSRYARSREARGALGLPVWNAIIAAAYYTSALGLLFVVAAVGASRLPIARTLAAWSIVWVLSNAVISYAFVGDFPRYQSRASWLMPLAALACGRDMRASRGGRGPASEFRSQPA